MRYDEIRRMITESSPGDWALIETGGHSLHQLGNVISSGQHWLEASTHTYLAVYEADADLRLAWGMQTDSDDSLEFEGWNFADPHIGHRLADGYWRGSLVTRWDVLSVDGGRCYLPFPARSVAITGESPSDTEMAGWKVTESEVALARLLQKLTRPEDTDFDDYLKRTGAVVVRG